MFTNSNRRQFQKGLDPEKARAKRCNTQLSLRRKQREARLLKKVRLLTNQTSSFNNTAGEDTDFKSIESIPLRKDISKFIANVMQTDNTSLQLSGLSSIRKLLATDDTPTKLSQHICLSGILPKIIHFMFNNNKTEILSRLAFESSWTITNICAATTECTLKVVRHRGIEAFVYLLRNEGRYNREVATQAIWGLGNIAGDDTSLQQRILYTGVIKDIVEIIDESSNLNSELQNMSVWCMSNMLRFGNIIKLKKVKQLNLLSILCGILRRVTNNEIVQNCLWTFNFLSVRGDEMCDFMVAEGCIDIVMKLLNIQVGKYEIAVNQSNNTKKAMLSLDGKIYRPCLRFIGNILSCGDELTQRVLDCGYLDVIEPFTYHFVAKQRKEVMWSLSNILAGTPTQIECILSRNKLIKSIITCATHDILPIKIEACHGICNVVVNEANTFLKKQLAELGAIEALCSLLNPINNISEKNILIIMEGLESFLETFGDVMNINPFAQQIEECQGLDYLEARSADNNISEETWHSICNLMRKYWGDLKEQEIPCVIHANTNGKQFKFGTNSFINNSSYDENNNSVRFNF